MGGDLWLGFCVVDFACGSWPGTSDVADEAKIFVDIYDRADRLWHRTQYSDLSFYYPISLGNFITETQRTRRGKFTFLCDLGVSVVNIF